MKKQNFGHRYRGATAGLALLGLAAVAGCGGAPAEDEGFARDADTLVFGIVPDTTASGSTYEPIAHYLSSVTGKEVEIIQSSDYSALINAAVADKVDVAMFSGFTYVIATSMGAEITPVAGVVTEEGEEPGYYSEAIVPESSDIESLEEFRGESVCFVDPGSTSGYLWPSAMLTDVDIDPEQDVTPVFAGKHDAAVLKVAEGRECAAGFAESVEVVQHDDVRVVARELVPGMPLVVSEGLPEELRNDIADAVADVTPDDMVTAGVSEADDAHFREAVVSLTAVDDGYYDTVREVCRKVGDEKCQA